MRYLNEIKGLKQGFLERVCTTPALPSPSRPGPQPPAPRWPSDRVPSICLRCAAAVAQSARCAGPRCRSASLGLDQKARARPQQRQRHWPDAVNHQPRPKQAHACGDMEVARGPDGAELCSQFVVDHSRLSRNKTTKAQDAATPSPCPGGGLGWGWMLTGRNPQRARTAPPSQPSPCQGEGASRRTANLPFLRERRDPPGPWDALEVVSRASTANRLLLAGRSK